ncbi:hypothetical protein [Inquilinus limosus]|uniref:Uncharacterized protein n=1 Tax=Inquilinus limosus MP06 TaxID=1398085 RepID=A0A0A0DGJ5_9PROT|nr:hypothetical protein [Inquilinus limosus]KGM36117.1 hypothetical protein P409_00265 [Inquilinus limosus MP06]
MLETAFTWLVGTAAGRWILVALLAIAAGIVAYRVVYAKGQDEERLKATQRTIEVLTTKVTTDEEIRSLPRADRRKRLRTYARD